MGILRERGVVPAVPNRPVVPSSPLLEEYARFLAEHRGIGDRSIDLHRKHVGAFLKSLGPHRSPASIANLDAGAVFRFITKRAEKLTRFGRSSMCAAVRSFLRFLYLRGYVRQDFASSVPVIPEFKLARLPRVIDSDSIKRIIAVVEHSTPMGQRDNAILLILATYGLRSSQLCRLQLCDIDWRRETIIVRGAKGGRDVVLPLQAAVREALIVYLRQGRIPHRCREVFLRLQAPVGPLRPRTLKTIIRTYARKAGVTGVPINPHAWRHACAGRMLAKGHTLKTIRDVLGHRSIETTYIYTKVDLEMLRQAALDWPGVTS